MSETAWCPDYFPVSWARPTRRTATRDQRIGLVNDAVASRATHVAVQALRYLLDATTDDGAPDYPTRIAAARLALFHGLQELL